MELDEHSRNLESLELISSNRKYLLSIVLGYSLFIIPWALFLFTFDAHIAFVGLAMPLLVYFALWWGLIAIWSRRTEIFLSRDTFRICVDRHLFLQLRWDKIEKIIAFREEFEVPMTRYHRTNTNMVKRSTTNPIAQIQTHPM